SVGAKLVADKFLQPQTLGILLLGVIAFGIGTAAGVLMAKLLNKLEARRTIQTEMLRLFLQQPDKPGRVNVVFLGELNRSAFL
ncbi:sodium ion-translocating decarboxylase subunit beta, partial [Salmonella enterica subsp. enterica serovar Anatum]|nr:sodium ion-translocating decarboxylase subunit beta [Salmonella enterica subsp. enterica serovar Anatum]